MPARTNPIDVSTEGRVATSRSSGRPRGSNPSRPTKRSVVIDRPTTDATRTKPHATHGYDALANSMNNFFGAVLTAEREAESRRLERETAQALDIVRHRAEMDPTASTSTLLQGLSQSVVSQEVFVAALPKLVAGALAGRDAERLKTIIAGAQDPWAARTLFIQEQVQGMDDVSAASYSSALAKMTQSNLVEASEARRNESLQELQSTSVETAKVAVRDAASEQELGQIYNALVMSYSRDRGDAGAGLAATEAMEEAILAMVESGHPNGEAFANMVILEGRPSIAQREPGALQAAQVKAIANRRKVTSLAEDDSIEQLQQQLREATSYQQLRRVGVQLMAHKEQYRHGKHSSESAQTLEDKWRKAMAAATVAGASSRGALDGKRQSSGVLRNLSDPDTGLDAFEQALARRGADPARAAVERLRYLARVENKVSPDRQRQVADDVLSGAPGWERDAAETLVLMDLLPRGISAAGRLYPDTPQARLLFTHLYNSTRFTPEDMQAPDKSWFSDDRVQTRVQSLQEAREFVQQRLDAVGGAAPSQATTLLLQPSMDAEDVRDDIADIIKEIPGAGPDFGPRALQAYHDGIVLYGTRDAAAAHVERVLSAYTSTQAILDSDGDVSIVASPTSGDRSSVSEESAEAFSTATKVLPEDWRAQKLGIAHDTYSNDSDSLALTIQTDDFLQTREPLMLLPGGPVELPITTRLGDLEVIERLPARGTQVVRTPDAGTEVGQVVQLGDGFSLLWTGRYWSARYTTREQSEMARRRSELPQDRAQRLGLEAADVADDVASEVRQGLGLGDKRTQLDNAEPLSAAAAAITQGKQNGDMPGLEGTTFLNATTKLGRQLLPMSALPRGRRSQVVAASGPDRFVGLGFNLDRPRAQQLVESVGLDWEAVKSGRMPVDAAFASQLQTASTLDSYRVVREAVGDMSNLSAAEVRAVVLLVESSEWRNGKPRILSRRLVDALKEGDADAVLGVLRGRLNQGHFASTSLGELNLRTLQAMPDAPGVKEELARRGGTMESEETAARVVSLSAVLDHALQTFGDR